MTPPIFLLGHHLFHRVGAHRDFLNLHQEGLFGNPKLSRSETRRKEREADIFAAYLLIPEEKLKDSLKEESDYTLAGLAEEFQVSEELMRKRLEFEEISR